MKIRNHTLYSAIALAIALSMSACGGGGGGGGVRPDNPPVQPPPGDPGPDNPDDPDPDEGQPDPDEGQPDPDEGQPDPDEGQPDPEPEPDPDEPEPEPDPDPVPDPEPDPDPEPFDPNAPVPAPAPVYLGHLGLSNVSAAWEMGYTGKGEIIGVIDSGADEHHPTLEGKVVGGFSVVGEDQANSDPSDPNGHGTYVSQVLVGSRIGAFQQGVAPDAKIFVGRVMNDNEQIIHTHDALRQMMEAGVRLVNNSWNSKLKVLPDDPPEARNSSFARVAREFVGEHGGLIVFANGNQGEDQPGSFSALPYSWPGLEQGWLAVTATDLDGNIAGYANHCGLAAQWCLAAPGNTVAIGKGARQGDESYNYYSIFGTSFAAPVVTGTAALVWEAFPWMSNDLVRKSILGTAKDVGEAGVDDVFGHGILDAGKAVRGLGRLDWGVEELDVSSGSYAFSNDISGEGGIVKQGPGSLFLTGENTYTGGTSVEGGLLYVDGSVRGNVGVLENGSLAGKGTIYGNIANQGRVLVRNGGLTVDGNWTQGENSEVSFELGSTAFVTGTFQADGYGLVDRAAGGYVVSSTETLLEAGNVDGEFVSFTVNPSLFLTGDVFYTDTSIGVNLEQVEATSLAALGKTRIDAENVKQADHAFQVANELTKGERTAEQDQFLDMMADIQGISDPGVATSVFSSISGQGQVLVGAGLLNAQRHESQLMQKHIDTSLGMDAGAWVSGGKLNSRISPEGWAQAKTQGSMWMAGVDHDFAHARAGVSVNDGEHDIDFDSGLGRARISTTGVGVHGQTQVGGWDVSGQVRISEGTIRAQRRIDIAPNTPDVRYEQDVRQLAARVQVSSGMNLSGGSSLTPFASIGYGRIRMDGAQEQGGDGFGLGYLGQTHEQGDVQVGARWEGVPMSTASGWRVRLGGWAGLGYDFLGSPLSAKAYYQVDRESVFTMEGPGMDRWWGSYGLGVVAGKDNISAFLRLDGQQAPDRRDNSVSAGVKLHW